LVLGSYSRFGNKNAVKHHPPQTQALISKFYKCQITAQFLNKESHKLVLIVHSQLINPIGHKKVLQFYDISSTLSEGGNTITGPRADFRTGSLGRKDCPCTFMVQCTLGSNSPNLYGCARPVC
jgi:hypothetical protein